jgi:predicted DNA-binding protein YlxM (UPF0122 family)
MRNVPQSIRDKVVTFNSYRPWQDEDHLRELYHERGMSQREIAEALNCRRQTILKWMNRFDIEARSTGIHQTPKPLQDPEWLRQQHHELDLSFSEIAEKVDCSARTVSAALDRHNIDKRRRDWIDGETRDILRSEDRLRSLYVDEELSSSETAERIGCSQNAVMYWLRKHNIETRESGGRSGENHPNWKPPEERASNRDYYSKRWQEIRRNVLDRDNYTCQRCGMTNNDSEDCYDRGLNIHHIEPLTHFDSRKEADELSNLLAVCIGCHNDIEGLPIDNRHLKT